MSERKRCRKCREEFPRTLEYFNRNKTCKDGMLNICKACTREESRKWREENREKKREYDRKRWHEKKEVLGERFKEYYQNNKSYFNDKATEYREKNKEELYEYQRKYNQRYRRANKEQLSAKKKKYYLANRDKAAIARQRRRSKELSVPHTLTEVEWKETLEFFDHKDAYTGLPMEKPSQDHVIPVSKGGGFTKQNIVPCELSINISKGNRDMENWYRKQDFFSEERLKKIQKFMGVKNGVLQISLFD